MDENSWWDHVLSWFQAKQPNKPLGQQQVNPAIQKQLDLIQNNIDMDSLIKSLPTSTSDNAGIPEVSDSDMRSQYFAHYFDMPSDQRQWDMNSEYMQNLKNHMAANRARLKWKNKKAEDI